MSSEFENRRRAREHDPDLVKCAHCGRLISKYETTCPKCGVHFRGAAFQFSHETDELEAERAKRRRRARFIGLILAILFGVGISLYFFT